MTITLQLLVANYAILPRIAQSPWYVGRLPQDDGFVVGVCRAVRKDTDQPFDFNRIIPKPPIVNEVSDGSFRDEVKANNPNRNRYEWSIENWDTKWNAYVQKLRSNWITKNNSISSAGE